MKSLTNSNHIQLTVLVTNSDIAQFDDQVIHSVYATFAIARDAEHLGRLLLLELIEPDEEGIGTSVLVQHRAPAFIGDSVQFTITNAVLEGNRLTIQFSAKADGTIIATGSTEQKILKRTKIERLFNK